MFLCFVDIGHLTNGDVHALNGPSYVQQVAESSDQVEDNTEDIEQMTATQLVGQAVAGMSSAPPLQQVSVHPGPRLLLSIFCF